MGLLCCLWSTAFPFFPEERGLHSACTSWTLCFGDSCRQELLFLRCSVFLEKVVKCRSRTAAQQNSELVLVVFFILMADVVPFLGFLELERCRDSVIRFHLRIAGAAEVWEELMIYLPSVRS